MDRGTPATLPTMESPTVPTPESELPEDLVIPIRYDDGTGRPRNAGFEGEGSLTIRGGGVAYVFEGRVRSMFSSKHRTLEIKPGDIWNVAYAGRLVQFAPSRIGVRRAAPFVFYCRSEQEAAVVAKLLPANVEAGYRESVEFSRKLWTAPTKGVSVTNVIIGINVAVFVAMAGLLNAGWLQAENMRPYILYGANNAGATTDGEWWRLVTSMFMHFGLPHIAFNMWAYYQAGHLAERLFGRRLYAFGYLMVGIGGSLASLYWNGDKVWSAGASGAIFGVYGMILGYLLREREHFPSGVFKPMVRSTVMFAVYNLAFGSMVAGIDNSAHVGGFITGIGLGWLMARPLEGAERHNLFGRRLAAGLAAAVAIVALGVSAAPRFDYHFREELAWEDAVAPFAKREQAITSRLNQAGSDLNSGALTDDERTWARSTAVPFYSDWLRSVEGLHLTPGLATAKRRDVVLAELKDCLSLSRRIAGDSPVGPTPVGGLRL